MRNCGILQIWQKLVSHTVFLYHSMCFVHWFVLSCLYTKITINTYIVCYIQFVCSRLIRFLCTCLFISVIFFRNWLHSMECTTPLCMFVLYVWMYGYIDVCVCVCARNIPLNMCTLGKFRALLILIILFHLFWAWNTFFTRGISPEIELEMHSIHTHTT